MTKLIAEIGWNHMGDMKLAKEMILAAKESGADFAKFQTWSVRRLKRGSWDTDGRRQIYEKAELSFDKHIELKKYCDEDTKEPLGWGANKHPIHYTNENGYLRTVTQKLEPGMWLHSWTRIPRQENRSKRLFLDLD